jgi:hypothetical protein
MEPSKEIRRRFLEVSDAQNMTNAGIKMVEILATFPEFIPRGDGQIDMFDNASAPGSFVFATNYWARAMLRRPLNWRASTLISAKDNTALGDTYGLAKLNPHRISTTGTNFNGDTTDVEYLRHMSRGIKHDLYTSDIGIDIGTQYDQQEALNAAVNLGQVLMALLVLRRGGTMLTKQYTHHSSFTISLMAAVAASFESAFVIKPISSKPDNSEEYLIAFGFKGTPPNIIAAMFNHLTDTPDFKPTAMDFTMPLFKVPRQFVEACVGSAEKFATAQCSKIAANLAEVDLMSAENRSHPSEKFKEANTIPGIRAWMKLADWRRMCKTSYLHSHRGNYKKRR